MRGEVNEGKGLYKVEMGVLAFNYSRTADVATADNLVKRRQNTSSIRNQEI